MWIILKLFFTIISIAILWFLIITSFLISQYDSTDSSSLLSNFEIDVKSLTWWVMYKSLGNTDDVFYSTWEIQTTLVWNKTIIDLIAWEYIFSLSSIWSEFEINYKWFSLKNMWPGIFYINTTNEKRYWIFSLSSLLRIELLKTLDNSYSTDVFLYPHWYMLFDPERNYLVSGWDALRVSSVLSWVWYFNNNILDINWEINPDFFKSIWPILKDESFFTTAIKTIFYNNKILYSRLWEIRKEEKSFTTWSKLLEKYDWLFINKTKKDSFYKSIIFNDLDDLFVSKNRENKLVNNIYSNYVKLNWKLDSDIQRVFNNYYRYISLESNFAAKQNFYSLYQKLSNNKVEFLWSLFYLRDIYNDFDFIWSDNLYSDITLFTKSYFSDLNINIWKDKLLIKDEDYSKLDYFSLYLMKLLLTSNSFDKETVSKVISIFDYYVLLDNNLYWWQNEKKIATWVKNHLDVLTNISKSIRSYYFEEDRSEFNLLVKKKIEINSNNIEEFQKNINSLISFFDENIYIFSEKDPKIESYKNISKDMDEYFLALLDFEWYKSSYTSNSIINTWNETKYLKEEDAVNLLSNFENLFVNWIEVDIVNDEYFVIKWLEFNYEPLWFKLYPYKNNLIDEINIWWNMLEWNYELWEKQDSNGTISPWVWETFFIEIFTWYDKWNWEVTYYNSDDDPEYISTDDLVFKRDILLWDSWKFSELKDILNMRLNNIKIKDKKKWEITLTWALLKINTNKVVKNNKISYNSEFSSDYKLTSSEDYFENIRLKIIENDIKKKERDYLLFWNEIKLNWKISNNGFKKQIVDFGDVLYDLIFIWNKINEVLWKDSLDIEYSLIRKKLTIKLFYLKKPLVISLIKWKIDFISYKWKNILDSKIELDKLEENLFDLKTK